MKKIFAVLLLSLMFSIPCFAQEDGKTPVNYIYIHGSDQGTVEEFDIWIRRMHPDMIRNLNANEFVKENLLKDAYIKEEPDMLYWADRTLKDKSAVEIGLKLSKIVSSCIAQLTRSTLAHLLHDAIWLQKYINMRPILAELNKKVIENSKKGEKNVLVGYSAGTFITYQYLLNKGRIFNLEDFFSKFQSELGINAQDMTALKNLKTNTTCMDAVIDSKIAVLSAEGDLIPVSDKTQLRENFKKLNSQTELSCAPKDAVKGVINFGSPVVIFYSDNYADDSQQYYFLANLYKHVIENNQFVLTVNYKTDPLGVPAENYTFEDAKNYLSFKDIKNGGGFIYDTSVSGGIMFASSHLKYWDQTNHFTKAIARSYEEGYKKFYSIEDKK